MFCHIKEKYLYDLYSEKISDKIYADNVKIIESETAKYGIEEPFETPNGMIWVRSDKMPYKDASGKVIGVIGVLFDITDQKERDKDIKESEEKFRIIAERSFDIIIVADEKGVCSYVSPSIERVLGYKPDEIVSKHFQILFPDKIL